jgi:NUMOD4 motif
MIEEEWRVITDFPNYMVSNHGRIKPLARKVWQGTGFRNKKEKLLKLSITNDGYLGVVLYNGSSQSNQGAFVHKLVLDAFVGKRSSNQQDRHLDGVKTNNMLTNIIWGTCVENCDDKRRHGTLVFGERSPLSMKRGELNHKAKLTEFQVKAIRSEPKYYGLIPILCKKYGVCENTIRAIRDRKMWKHID